MVKKKILIARRVSYGKKNTPLNKREYRLITGGPVGTKDEWRRWSKKEGVRIKFIDK
jgi:hypothetical protein